MAEIPVDDGNGTPPSEPSVSPSPHEDTSGDRSDDVVIEGRSGAPGPGGDMPGAAWNPGNEAQEGPGPADVADGGTDLPGPGGDMPGAAWNPEGQGEQDRADTAEGLGEVAIEKVIPEETQKELSSHDDDQEHSRGNEQLAYYEAKATEATSTLIANLEKMDLPSEQKEGSIKKLQETQEASVATARAEYFENKKLAEKVFEEGINKAHLGFTRDSMHINLLSTIKKELDESYPMLKYDGVDKARLPSMMTVDVVMQLAQAVGADASDLVKLDKVPKRSELDISGNSRLTFPTSLGGYNLVIDRVYGKDAKSTYSDEEMSPLDIFAPGIDVSLVKSA